jgi:hypothetical protein
MSNPFSTVVVVPKTLGVVFPFLLRKLSEADAEWGTRVFADVIESLKKGRYVKKDAKFLKRIEEQGDNNNKLKDTDVFKDFKEDCVKNLQDRCSDTQKCMTEFLTRNPRNIRAVMLIPITTTTRKMSTIHLIKDDDDESPRKKAAVRLHVTSDDAN